MADADRIVSVLCEGVYRRCEHILHRLGLFFLHEDHGQIHDVAHHDGRGDPTCFDGDDFIGTAVGKESCKLLGYVVHQLGVHLMIDEAIDLQDATRVTFTVL